MTVNYATSDGTAKHGTDYNFTAGLLSFAAGEPSKTFSVPIINNSVADGSRTVNLALSGPNSNAILGSPSTAVLTINDDDGQPPPNLSISDVSLAEGNSGTSDAIFNVSLSSASNQSVMVNYATTDNSAIASTDYQSANGTLTFNPGETSKSINVAVLGDTVAEVKETFFVNLSNPANAVISDAQGLATIINDDLSAGSLIISEFRFRGPNGEQDEFIELYNNANADVMVTTTDNSDGWALVASDGIARFTIPNGTMIPARAHYLATCNAAPSLSAYSAGKEPRRSPTARNRARGRNASPASTGATATGDITYGTSIPDNAGIALFRSSNPANFTEANRLDAVGFSGVATA